MQYYDYIGFVGLIFTIGSLIALLIGVIKSTVKPFIIFLILMFLGVSLVQVAAICQKRQTEIHGTP